MKGVREFVAVPASGIVAEFTSPREPVRRNPTGQITEASRPNTFPVDVWAVVDTSNGLELVGVITAGQTRPTLVTDLPFADDFISYHPTGYPRLGG